MKHLADLLGESPGIEAIRDKIVRLLERQRDARRLPPVLIEGETGTGKGLLARLIHRAGPRPNGPFVDVNCAAIPETLLEAEMFGFERGAFTDARRAKPGLFQAANRGTIFLDEVGLLSEALQAKLLKVIEERSVRRLGSTRDESIDVWILTATNEDLRAAIRARRFREDLYHRLAVLTLTLPPLRTRAGDVLMLAEHYLGRACADYGVALKTLAADARAALRAYQWPGNVRELANLMERVALLSSDPEVTADELGLPSATPAGPSAPAPTGAASSLDDAVRDRVAEVLRQTNWNISRTAAILGISRNTLRARIEKYGLRQGEAPAPALRTERRTARASGAPASAPLVVQTPASTPLRWERRRVTMLRVALIAPSAPETPLETSRSLEVLLDKIRTFGGRVEGRSPTGVVAAFGLDSIEDAPRRAAHAAMAIQNALARGRQAAGAGPAIKVAIHIGQFLVGQGNGAAELDVETKQAALAILESLIERAEPDGVVVSDIAAPFLERAFELLELAGAESARGRVFALARRERTGVGRGRRPATFVGRHRELELLWSRLESAIRGQGQIVGISGEAGIGKSRLLFEFREMLAGKSVTCLEGQCRSYGAAIPYLPILDVLRALCGIAEADTPVLMAEKARASLLEAGMDLVETAPSLLNLLGLEPGADRVAALEPNVMKARVFETLRQMTLRRSQRSPLIIVVEDVHWIDRTSEECVASLAEIVAGARLLLVSTYRPGYRPSWVEKSSATQVALQPLAPEDSQRILRSVLGDEHPPDHLVDLVVSKADGNPFFLEELARTIREQAGVSPALSVPDTIEEVLLGRIARLLPEDKQLLEVTAVVGKDVAFSVVRAVTGTSDDTLRGAFGRLKNAEFLYETGAGPEVEYTFKHALTHEVAYSSLFAEQRRALHARIMEAIERLDAERLTEHIERLAHHAFAAKAWDKAVRYLRQAGVKAFMHSAHREAVGRFEQALTALGHLPESRQTLEQAVDLRFDLRNSLLPLGEHGRYFGYLQEAEDLARRLEDRLRLGWVDAYRTAYLYLMGEQESALECGERALATADTFGDFRLKVSGNTWVGQVHYYQGDYRGATAFFRRNVESLVGEFTLERFGLPQLPSVHSRTCLAWCLGELGEFAEGISRGDEGLRIAESVDHPLSLTVACAGLGVLYLRKGSVERAIPLLERGLELCRIWNLRLWFPRVASALGSAYAVAGRIGEGLPLLEQAVDEAALMMLMGGHSHMVTCLGEGALLAGRVDDAVGLARRALELARNHKERGYQAWALRLLGDATWRADSRHVGGAEQYCREAMTLAEELCMHPLTAHTLLTLGKGYRRGENYARAGQYLASAVALFRERDMPFWAAQAQAELTGSS